MEAIVQAGGSGWAVECSVMSQPLSSHYLALVYTFGFTSCFSAIYWFSAFFPGPHGIPAGASVRLCPLKE